MWAYMELEPPSKNENSSGEQSDQKPADQISQSGEKEVSIFKTDYETTYRHVELF